MVRSLFVKEPVVLQSFLLTMDAAECIAEESRAEKVDPAEVS